VLTQLDRDSPYAANYLIVLITRTSRVSLMALCVFIHCAGINRYYYLLILNNHLRSKDWVVKIKK
jgi:hypothetical protein